MEREGLRGEREGLRGEKERQKKYEKKIRVKKFVVIHCVRND